VAQAALLTGREPVRHGNAHPQIVPYRKFSAADADFALAVGTDRQFARLAAMLGREEWAKDPAYKTNPARVVNRQPLEKALAEEFARAPRAQWLERCRAAGIPAGPVRGAFEALGSETARALGAVLEARGIRFVASPIRVAGHTAPMGFPPQLDADGPRIRAEFGLPR
jgi:crotonobetainyl-CoA:carnitine CoA-transferase CaiB-like acyl-CoA transferase